MGTQYTGDDKAAKIREEYDKKIDATEDLKEKKELRAEKKKAVMDQLFKSMTDEEAVENKEDIKEDIKEDTKKKSPTSIKDRVKPKAEAPKPKTLDEQLMTGIDRPNYVDKPAPVVDRSFKSRTFENPFAGLVDKLLPTDRRKTLNREIERLEEKYSDGQDPKVKRKLDEFKAELAKLEPEVEKPKKLEDQVKKEEKKVEEPKETKTEKKSFSSRVRGFSQKSPQEQRNLVADIEGGGGSPKDYHALYGALTDDMDKREQALLAMQQAKQADLQTIEDKRRRRSNITKMMMDMIDAAALLYAANKGIIADIKLNKNDNAEELKYIQQNMDTHRANLKANMEFLRKKNYEIGRITEDKLKRDEASEARTEERKEDRAHDIKLQTSKQAFQATQNALSRSATVQAANIKAAAALKKAEAKSGGLSDKVRKSATDATRNDMALLKEMDTEDVTNFLVDDFGADRDVAMEITGENNWWIDDNPNNVMLRNIVHARNLHEYGGGNDVTRTTNGVSDTTDRGRLQTNPATGKSRRVYADGRIEEID